MKHHHGPRLGALLAALWCGLAAWPARADDFADEADLHFTLGAERYQMRDFRGALEHFLLSNRLVPNRNVLFNIARSYEQLRQFPDAYRYYMLSLESEPDPAARERIEAAVKRITPEVAVLRVETDPPGATVYLDRKDLGPRGTSPRTMAFAPGDHKVIVEIPGYEPAVRSVTLIKGDETSVQLRLTRITGKVRVEGIPATATVRIDEATAPVQCTGPCVLDVPVGSHALVISDPRHEPLRHPVEVQAAREQTVRPALRRLKGALVVHTDERDAMVEVDGRPVGFTPVVVDVDVGTRKLRVSSPGFATVEQTVVIKPKQETKLDLELDQIEEVMAASRVNEAVEDAPSSVTIIPNQELRGMAYPTIAEAVRGVRGVYVSDDRTYKTVGIRGLSFPGSYGNRILVLLDGHPMNDDWIGSSYVDYDARTDLEDVQRIEVVRGPGSVLYGTNAFAGVINLVTRGTDQPTGGNVGLSTNEYGVGRARGMANVQLGKNAGFWLSAAGAHAEGRDFFLPEFVVPPTATSAGVDGIARGVDKFEAGTLTGRAWWGPVSLLGSFHSREKNIPTAEFGTIFNDPRTKEYDTRGFAELRVEPKLSRSVQLMTRASVDYYRFTGLYAYEPPPLDVGLGREAFRGVWASGEGRLVISPSEAVRITVGGEGQRHLKVHQTGTNDEGVYLDRDDPYSVAAGYALADIAPSKAFRISAGSRLDWYSTFGTSINPRAAFIVRPYEGGNLKILAGKAFRAPSIYELYYNDEGISQVPSPNLNPETIYSPEIEFTHRFSRTWTATAAGFANYVKDLIVPRGQGTQESPAFYENSPAPLLILGGELVVRREWRQGWTLSLSYAYQNATYQQDDDPLQPRMREVPNAPAHMGSLRGSAPIVARYLLASTRLTIEGPRYDRYDREGDPPQGKTDAAAIWDFVVSGQESRYGLRYAVGVYNAFDWQYEVPLSPEFTPRTLQQSGRTFLLSTSLDF